MHYKTYLHHVVSGDVVDLWVAVVAQAVLSGLTRGLGFVHLDDAAHDP